MYPELFALLSSVIGLVWLTLLPTSGARDWCGFDSLMTERIETSVAALSELR
jgi:hypothetical protein